MDEFKEFFVTADMKVCVYRGRGAARGVRTLFQR